MYVCIVMDMNWLSDRQFNSESVPSLIDSLPDTVTVIGRGSSRVVIDNGSTVIKIAVKAGISENITESKISLEAKGTELENRIAPVKQTGQDSQWIEMERVDNPSQSTRRFEDKTARRIARTFVDHDFPIRELEYGYIDGTPVAYDYGILRG